MEYLFVEQIIGVVLATIFGAVFGSYATLFAYRLPLGESCFGRYFGPKSRCPKCDSVIKTRDLIPLLNWFFTWGRCRKCKNKIPRTHLFVELATTILFVACYLKFSFGEEFILYSLTCVGLVILLATDYTHRIFPNQVLNFVLMIGLIIRVLHDQSIVELTFSAALGVVFATIFYQIFYKKTDGIFALEQQSFDYTKFILISSVFFDISLLMAYFLSILSIFTMLLLFEVPSKRKRMNFGYALIIPFIWLLLYPAQF